MKQLPPHLLNLRHKGPQSLSDLRASIVYAAIQYGFYRNSQLASFLQISYSAVSILHQNFLGKIVEESYFEVMLFQSLKQKLLNV